MSLRSSLFFCLILSFSSLSPTSLLAQTGPQDRNGDGLIGILGFGDSITYGVGDGTSPGQTVDDVPFTDGTQGYLNDLSRITGLLTNNRGTPGELLTTEGDSRFPDELRQSTADYVSLLEGANDAIFQVSPSRVRQSVQRIINVSRALGKIPLLLTLPPPCCGHQGVDFFTREYSSRIREAAAQNENALLVDIERAWEFFCPLGEDCFLYNLPEGLHPNSQGYEVIAQMVTSVLYGIDPFAQGSREEFALVLGIPLEQVFLPALPPAEVVE